jgi:hypothetical protein
MPTTTLIKIFAERYRHVPERILNNKDGRYQELQELIYLVHHDATTSPEQEAQCLLAALKAGGLVHPCYYTIVGRPDWQEVPPATLSDT